ncbi:uncharacterized protein LOC136031485 [Artemia franciscana]|uniref:Spaetzle domain-containing protein n=1 Tax=Artemia franciscana TaxID=6661 RepID=A0AA88H9H3_ARTSF|nr:hypothetical protein QYM36_017028 [Artemia franciscana]
MLICTLLNIVVFVIFAVSSEATEMLSRNTTFKIVKEKRYRNSKSSKMLPTNSWDFLLGNERMFPEQPIYECCPTVMELVEPKGAINIEGELVELFRDSETGQRFFEHSCRSDVVNKPCAFVDKKAKKHSLCVQKYTYTYALIRDFSSKKHWKLDYIKIRGGCACEILPQKGKKKKKGRKRRP